MANQGIFCNTPWYEAHIYWDGSMGICCQEEHKLYQETDSQFNIRNMSLKEWFNSEPVRQFRLKMLDNHRNSACYRCYIEEDHGGNSRRFKSNMKSVIFTGTAFQTSWTQSPGHRHFVYSMNNDGATETYPIDLHIDLGNYCNLACKMCNAKTSSTIASQHVRWGIKDSAKYLGTDWTRDLETWTRFKQELLDLPGLNNIHLMGGETLLTDRFLDLVNTVDQAGRHEICFSFVTNGTVWKPELMSVLSKFRRVGIEVSVETMTDHNAYVRQGTDQQLLLQNLEKYQFWAAENNQTVTLRPAVGLLTAGYYDTLLNYALEHKLVVKGLLCYTPDFLDMRILPDHIKDLYISRYQRFLSDYNAEDYNASDPNKFKHIVAQQAHVVIQRLRSSRPNNSELLLEKMVHHCQRWDKVYGLDAKILYPELREYFYRYSHAI